MGCCGGMLCDHDPCDCGDEGFTELDSETVQRTLLSSLVGCVDCVRDLYTQFGARDYEVALVRTAWTGGARGRGVEEVIGEVKLLPTPLISALTELDNVLTSIGQQETGGVRVSQISARYTEELLTGKSPTGQPIPKDQNFYYEIRDAGGAGRRRRFTVDSPPDKDPLKFEWVINLTRAVKDRTRSGDPSPN